MHQKSFMEMECLESPSIILQQQISNLDVISEITNRLRKFPPHFVGTIARGSSDQAAHFAKYAIETQLGIITTSIAPSIHTLYKSNLNYKNTFVIGISQSGKSNDLIECMSFARKNGAITLSFINEKNSPLEKESQYFIPLLAGKENSGAATKSFTASLTRIIQFICYWNNDNKLKECLLKLPNILEKSNDLNFKLALNELKNTKNMLVIGRGLNFPIALEAALKLKETCGIHAEAFSGAEILHGPFELIKKNFPVLVFLQNDETLESLVKLIEKLQKLNAKIIVISSQNILNDKKNKILNKTIHISTNECLTPLCDSVSLIYKFYPFVAALSRQKNKNPDTPLNLKKVTKTI